jgi:hypothetical protein
MQKFQNPNKMKKILSFRNQVMLKTKKRYKNNQ